MSIRRFIAVLARDFWNLVKLNLLFCLFALPSAALFALWIFGVWGGLALLASLALAFPVGGACSACLFCISKMLRDDPGYLWHDFKRKFKENFKQAALPGILCTAFVYMEVVLCRSFLLGAVSIGWVIAGFLPFVIFCMVAPYIFLQIAYIELKTAQIVKNSLLLTFANTGKSFAGILAGGAILCAFVLLLPDSLPYSPLLLAFGFSIPWIFNLAWIWPVVDKQFAIEETLRGPKIE